MVYGKNTQFSSSYRLNCKTRVYFYEKSDSFGYLWKIHKIYRRLLNVFSTYPIFIRAVWEYSVPSARCKTHLHALSIIFPYKFRTLSIKSRNRIIRVYFGGCTDKTGSSLSRIIRGLSQHTNRISARSVRCWCVNRSISTYNDRGERTKIRMKKHSGSQRACVIILCVGCRYAASSFASGLNS